MTRVSLLGINVDLLTMQELNSAIKEGVARGDKYIVANHNLHSVYLYHRDEKMRQFYSRAKLIHVDGMALILWGRILGLPIRTEHRTAYIDWIMPLMRMAALHGWRVFYLGGEPGVAERAAEGLRRKIPALEIRTHHGFFRDEESPGVLRQIAEWSPHLLLVGMGMPKQEHWIHDYWEEIEANIVLNAGACFDYIAGAKRTPPRWLGKIGMEWLYRLMSEPRRLFSRYLIEPWFLVPVAINDIVAKMKKYAKE